MGIYMPSEIPMRFRKLRIAFSVACAVVCLLLCVLWLRSYWWRDCLGYVGFCWLDSIEGYVVVCDSAFIDRTPGDPQWNILSVTSDVSPEIPGNFFFAAPYWLLELVSIAL